MKRHALLKPLISIFVLIALLGCANTQAVKQSSQAIEAPAVLTSIRVDENRLVIQSNKQFTYTLNKTSDPYRASVEIPDMNAGAFTGKIVSDNGVVTEVVPHQIDAPKRMTRLDIVMQSPSSLTPEYRDNTLVLSIKKDDPLVFTEARNVETDPKSLVRLVAVEIPAEKEATPAASKATEINNITVKKSADTVKVIISGNGTMIPNVFPVNERIVVDIPDAALRAALPSQTLSPLKGIRAGKHKDKLRIVLDLKEKTNFDVTAIGNTIEISLMNKEDSQPQRVMNNSAKEPIAAAVPEAPEPAAAAKEPAEPAAATDGGYTGKKVSLDFQDADIVPIFRLLGDISGYNIVVNPEVKGKITLKLINVPWDQALDTILLTHNFVKVQKGNIIRILSSSAYESESRSATSAEKARKVADVEMAPTERKTYRLKFANAIAVKEQLIGLTHKRTFNDKTGEVTHESMIDEKKSLLSSRGSATADRTSNIVIVEDIPAKMVLVDAFIIEIDQPIKQILIEARIVEVNTDYLYTLGIQWGAFSSKATGNGTYSIGSPTANLINLPASSIAGQLGFGFINRAGTLALDLQLSAMEDNKKGKIISQPKLLTMDTVEAYIKQGRKLQLPAVDDKGQPSLKEVPVNLTLKVLPTIAPSGAIHLDLSVIKEELLQLINNAGSTGADVANTDIKTKVLVNDGETLVVGGVFKLIEAHSDKGVPGLSKLPVLGQLFKNDNNSSTTSEIIIFVTPRVIESISQQ